MPEDREPFSSTGVPSYSSIVKISIITCCYNNATTIQNCLENVLSQDYPDVEHIVIDGASNDGTMEILKSYAPRIAKFVSEPDDGLYNALNRGFALATGDIVGILHADDELYSTDVLSRVARCFEQDGCDLLYGDGVLVSRTNPEKVVRIWKSGSYRRGKIAHGWLPFHTTIYVTKAWLDKCGGYDEQYRISSDSDWSIRSLYDMEPKVSYIPDFLVRMRMGGISNNPRKMIKKWGEDIRIFRAHGLPPYVAIGGKISRKIPQFIKGLFT